MDSRARYSSLWAVLCLLNTFCLTATLQSQESAPANVAMVTDWTHHHLVFSPPRSGKVSDSIREEPRYWQQLLRRHTDDHWRRRERHDPHRHHGAPPPKQFKRDWAASLGPGATVGAGNYPAKYSFDLSTAHCASDANPDFVVFNTSVAGSGSQASVVAFDNLYNGGCTGTVPTTYWAYNTGGAVSTSVVFSVDGTQLVFVQSVSGQAQLVLLKWQSSTTATSTSPDSISVVGNGQYSTCTAPCMTTVAFSGGANDSISSPYLDYSSDTLFVGDDAGALHKFTPIFHAGTPAEVTTGWPVTVASGLKLNSPVYDGTTGRVFVGSGYNGTTGSQLFAVNGSTGAVAGTSSSLGKGVGIAGSLLVDSTAGRVYVFMGNDGGSGCSGPCMAIYQFAASFTSGSGTKAAVGMGGSFPLYAGDFDNAYFTSPSHTGNLMVCGGGGGTAAPTIYRVPITSGVMSGSAVAGPALALSNVACSAVTDIFNPQGSGADRIFAAVTSGSDAAACAAAGCITNLVSSTWKASTGYSTGQVVLDGSNFMQVATNTGTSGATTPSWVDNCGQEITEGGVTWVNAGFLTPVTPQAWQAITFWSVGSRILDSNQNIECVLQTGIASGAFHPTWSTTIGGTTTELTGLQWRNGGPLPSHALPASGGTSGVIMDNIAGSAGSSQVYFSTLGTGACGAGNGCAVQASQAALN